MEKHEEATQECLAIGYNDEGISCLMKVIEDYAGDDICHPKLVLLVQDGCEPCKEQAKRFESQIKSGLIEKRNISSDEGLAISKINNIEYIPSLVLVDCNDIIINPV